MQASSETTARIDKWLWTVRLYKTRSLATEACRSGRISISGQTVKASREVRAGDVILISTSTHRKTVKVVGIPRSRVGAALLPVYMDDLTPAEEKEKAALLAEANRIYRPYRPGRPSKKDRRDLDRLNLGDW